MVLTLAAMLAAGSTLRAQLQINNAVPVPAAITISAGDMSSPDGSLAVSCGEVATEYDELATFTVVNITMSFQQGVQQPLTPRDEATNGITPLTVNLEVYPNPATECVNIEAEGNERLHYTLYTLNGQQLQQGQYNGGQQRIDLSSYASGNYLLRVASQDNTQVNTYKIILVR